MTIASRQTYAPPKRYTFRQLEEIWVGAGGPRVEAPWAASIALAESGGDPNAINHNSNGSIDRGLWQINSVHGKLSTTNVAGNALAAVKLHSESQFTPWVTFKTGAYKKFLTPANIHGGINVEKGSESIGILQQSIEAAGGALERVGFGAAVNVGAKAAGKPAPSSTVGKQVKEAEKPIDQTLEKFSWPGLLKFAVTAVLLLAGMVLVVYGIMVAVRPRESAFSLPRMPMPIPV